MKQIKMVLIAIAFIVILLGIIFGAVKANKSPIPKYEIKSSEGYAPYKFSVHKGWISDTQYEFPTFRRKISQNKPKSNFFIQVQKVSDIVDNPNITLDDYINEHLLKEYKEKYGIVDVLCEDTKVDGMPAKSLVYNHDVTIRDFTRNVKSHAIVLLVGGYVYVFNLTSFEGDFEIADREYRLMVDSFHFKK